MSVSGFNPTQTVAWQALNRMAAGAGQIDIKSLLSKDELRVKNYSIACGGLYLDYSKNLVTDDIVEGLLALVEASPLKQQRQAMFRGDIINASEQRPALHPALRLSVQAVAETGLEAL